MKTKIFAVISLFFLAFKVCAQDYKFIYYLDKDLNSTTKSKALIIGKGYQKNGIFTLDCFLKSTGRRTVSATVKDSSLSTLHGMFTTFYDDMKTESEGNYSENEMDGVWKYWDTSGRVTDSVIYRQGTRIAYGSYKYYFKDPTIAQLLFSRSLKDTLSSYRYSFTDSLKNTFAEREVSIIAGKEKLNFEADFIGDRGLVKEYDSTGAVKTDSVFTRQYVEAEFMGGEDTWRNFLRKTLNPNVPAENNAPFGKYTVVIKFIVNADGTLGNIEAENDPGYGMVAEAIRVLKMSRKWLPAYRYGKYQRAYRRQPVIFLIEDGGRQN
jgi:antitoxin component YwqK of YwqJK toxin-antitoxin module